ncbi:MAG TPA: hypothetical protein VK871_07825 [Candidatus Limnocylindrales bacterium]|nr:hypothetical protein [Candidatus Limnocylindrales bacterium]
MRALPIFALTVALVAGCARPPVPDAIGLPSGTAAPPADPTAIPTAPAEALERIASIEQDGVRLTIELERNPLPAGEPTWLTTTVANTGPDELRWITDACDIDVSVCVADPDFGEWLLQRPFRDGVDWYIRYVADEDAWQVSIQAWPNPPARLAVIDAQTGLLREVRGRS